MSECLDSQLLKSVNGNALPPSQMHNLVGGVTPVASSPALAGVPQQHNMLNVDNDLIRARALMRERIFGILSHRQHQPVDETTRMKFRDISKRLEEGLFKAAHTNVFSFFSFPSIQREDYMNLDTLEHRLSSLIKGRAGNSTSSIGTMMVEFGRFKI